MQALLLAGGKGTRLLPYTTIIPKPLMPIGDMPVMELLVRQLRASGVTEILVAIGHLGSLIEAFFQDGTAFGVSIRYLRENQPLGTAGPLTTALPELGEDFLVLNGDLLTTLNFAKLLQAHRETQADATVSVFPREMKSEFGVIEQDNTGLLIGYHEKPVQTFVVSMGCYAFRRTALLPHLKPGEPLDMPALILRLHDAGANVRCHSQACRWLDIGRPEDHLLANEWFAEYRHEFLPLET
ncbi:MAG: sugar phosphate nucleotidyltransferase [Chthoniobacterales bacterium]